jgi:hypothetical protein
LLRGRSTFASLIFSVQHESKQLAAILVDEMHKVLDKYVASRDFSTILDIGGWFLPYQRATHVIDLLPWETRGGRLQLEKLPGEKFSKQTWIGIDICDPQTPFPLADKSIDFVVCSGTLEDLADPRHCASEMRRVGRAGYIRVPSIFEELTIGIEDRTNNIIGYHHHNWVCRQDSERHLTMMAKPDAKLSRLKGEYIPHRFAERRYIEFPSQYNRNIHFFWEADYQVSYETGPRVRQQILTYLDDLQIASSDYISDAAYRLARNVRDRFLRRGAFVSRKSTWWDDMLMISKPYSDPVLWRKAGGRTNETVKAPRRRPAG